MLEKASELHLRSIQHDLQSIKYHQLHCSCITAPLRWHFVQLDIQQTRYSGLLSVTRRGKKTGKYMTKNLTFISQRMEHFCWFGYLNQLGKYSSVHSIASQTHWKENSLSSPPPLRKFTSFRPPYPSNFCDPPWRSYGYFLEPHIFFTPFN